MMEEEPWVFSEAKMFELPTDYIETYKNDKRKPINEIYQAFTKLSSEKWVMDILYNQEFEIDNKKISLPIIAFRTKKTGRAIWLIAGVHGEEPAGTNALSKNIKFLNKLAQKIPIVLLPMCNPKGYVLNWRYPSKRRMRKNMTILPGVGSAEQNLIDEKSPTPKARANEAPCIEALKITNYTIKTSKVHKPLLVMDFHEDYGDNKIHIYSQGELKFMDPIANEIVKILRNKGFEFYEKKVSPFDPEIKNGIGYDVRDDTVDELLASKKIFVNGRIINGPAAKSVIVIETPSRRIPLKKRVRAHSMIIKNLKRYFSTAQKISPNKEEEIEQEKEETEKISQ